MVATAAALALLAALLVAPVSFGLASARWVSAEPRAALVLWQALGLAAGLAAVGAALAVSLRPIAPTLPAALLGWLTNLAAGRPVADLGPLHVLLLAVALALLAWLLGVTASSAWGTWRSRRRHRELVDLVSSPWPGAAGGPERLVDHPAATAYCLPGPDARVVVTTGAIELLAPAELAAVLAHENAHLVERHDLVILPFAAWAAALPWLRGPVRARAAVGRLVEMVADDRACAGRDRHVLAAALARVGAAGVPAGALGAATHGAGAHGDSVLVERVRRLLDPPPRSARARIAAYGCALALLAVPTTALVLPAL